MKKITPFLFTLFGIIALSAIMVCSFAACGGGGGGDPVIPAEYRNTKYQHAEGATLELTTDKVVITLANGTKTTYSFTEIKMVNGNTVLQFNTNSNIAGLITIKDGEIIGIVFPVLTKSGGWSDGSGSVSGNEGTFTSITDMKAWLSKQPNNTAATAHIIRLNISGLGGDWETFGSVGYVLQQNENKYVNLDLSGSTITSIEERAFLGCYKLTSVIIPNRVTSIEEDAFFGCRGLTSITIPNSVTSIGKGAFKGCSGLTSVTIPNSVTSIGADAFNQCTGLTSVTIPNSVTSIKAYAFFYCTGLTSVTIPNSVTSIEEGTFSKCTSLTSITIPDSVTSIKNGAFEDCTGLTGITIPNSVTSIGERIFKNCTGLTSLNIPNSVNSISGYTFEGCTGLTSVTIPNSVTSIGMQAFYGCTGLTSLNIPNSVNWISDDTFKYCTGLTSINVDTGNNRYTAQDGILYENYNKNETVLHTYPAGKTDRSFIIPNNITRIGDNAFYKCSNLTSVTIPNNVTRIGGGAFASCTSLTSVIFQGTISKTSFADYNNSFPGDLRRKFYATDSDNGTSGTYTTTAPVDNESSVWTKQP